MRWLLALLMLTPAVACSCGPLPSPRDAWRSASLVFAGHVYRVNPLPSADPMADAVAPQAAWLYVEEPFKGVSARQTVRLEKPAGMCSWKAKVGERGVFYVHPGEKPGTWEMQPCRGSRLYPGVADDLAFLRALPRSAEGTRLSGTIVFDEKLGPQTLDRIPVRISGGKESFEIFTNIHGVFEIYGIPPGEYRVTPIVAKGLKAQSPRISGVWDYQSRRKRTITVAAGAAVSLEFAVFLEQEPGIR